MTDHKNIYAALAAAMADVKRLAKESRNVEQKYNFASVDDFLAMTGPICAQHGLIVCMDEDEVVEFERQGKYGPSFWLRIRFVLTVCHVSGECLPPMRRTVEVIRTGAQSFGSAQSYAIKQFLRALLQIPTGDNDDADFAEKGDGKPTSAKPPVPHQLQHGEAIKDAWKAAVEDSLPENATPQQKAEAYAEAICKEFAGKGEKALHNAWSRHAKIIEGLEARFPALHERIVDAFENRMMAIHEGAAA